MPEKTFLEDVLGSRTKVRMLHAMFSDDSKVYFEKELAEACGASVSEVNRQVGKLIEFGLVAYSRRGKKKLYSLNRSHFLFTPLRNVFTIV